MLVLGFDMEIEALFICVTLGLIGFGGVIVWSLACSRVWHPEA